MDRRRMVADACLGGGVTLVVAVAIAANVGDSGRGREFLFHIGSGRSNDEIAAELHITPATARTYVSRLLAKLQVRDRSQLVALAYRAGLRPPP